MSEKIEAIQRALQAKGFDPGGIDGVWGRATIHAVRAFQTARGLEVDGVVGPQTSAALFEGAAVAAPPVQPMVWFEEAKNQLGTKEKPGPASNPTLLDWAEHLDIAYKSDDIPWCGLFVAHCIGSTLTDETLPKNPLSARGWGSFGAKTDPKLGAVLVFWRKNRNGALGHVGFYAGEDDVAYRVLGGNQSDQVCVARVAKDRLLEARWPRTAVSVASAPLRVAAGASALSVHEA